MLSKITSNKYVKKHNINVIVDSALGHGKYTVARHIKELIENDEKLKFFNIQVKVTTEEDIDLENKEKTK